MDIDLFVNEIVEKEYARLNDKDKKYFSTGPDYISTLAHIGYGMYLRNKYMWGTDIVKYADPDDLSLRVFNELIIKCGGTPPDIHGIEL